MARALQIPSITILILHLCGSSAPCQQHNLTQLTFSDSTHDGYPSWSPDGDYIIYSSVTGSSCMTMKIPSQGGTPELVTEIFAQHARWSPVGVYIAFDGDFGTMLQMRLDPRWR